MKTILSCIFCLLAICVDAQLTGNQGIGAYAGGGFGEITPQMQQDQKNREMAEAAKLLNGHIYRRVNGQIVNLLASGQTVFGDVESVEDGVIVLDEPTFGGNGPLRRFAFTNYQGEVVSHKFVEARVVRAGTYRLGSEPIVLWDCGVLLSPKEEQQKLQEVNYARKAQQKILDDAAHLRNSIIQSNAFIHLLPHATNGQVWAQTSLAIRYLKGQGCETNQTQAVYWFQKAAAQGDLEASNYLEKINFASTNAASATTP